jgi:hypothetical protein
MRLQVLVVGTALALNFRRAGDQAHKGVVRRATGRTLTEQAPVGPLGRPIRLLAVTRSHRL